MEGGYFYWLFWIFFIISAFFIDDRKWRFRFSAFALMAIICSISSVEILSLECSFTGLFFLLTSYFYISGQTRKMIYYFLITSITVMFAYGSFCLFSLYEPAWLFIDGKWLLSILIVCLLMLLHGSFFHRIAAMLSGTIQGELLYASILKKLSISYPAGSLQYLDSIALMIAFLAAAEGIKRFSYYLEQHMNAHGKEKQKLS